MNVPSKLTRFLTDYGMLAVLALLCLLFSALTLSEQHPSGAEAARAILSSQAIPEAAGTITIVTLGKADDSAFAATLVRELHAAGKQASVISGDPSAIRSALVTAIDSQITPGAIITINALAPVLRSIAAQFPALANVPIVIPPSRTWPTFLLADNVRNVANQIAVIAVIAVGMTMVIITAGIDLSVGSLIALSAVVAAQFIGWWGGQTASTGAMIVAALAAMLMCGGIGAFSGLMITRFRIPPFIATLATMQVAAGLAYIISQGKPIYQIPERFTLLGRGSEPWLHIPWAVMLMIGLYVLAHVFMSRTTLGRYIYAVGGNSEAARLSGIRVNAILLLVYTVCGVLAGLGGIMMSSQLRSGAPTYGLTYELYVIAAVVVGGTSLSGGEGRIFGTLIGAFIIAVIQNGMNLTNVESYTQKVVLGLVILAAVLLDRLKQRGLARRREKTALARE